MIAASVNESQTCFRNRSKVNVRDQHVQSLPQLQGAPRSPLVRHDLPNPLARKVLIKVCLKQCDWSCRPCLPSVSLPACRTSNGRNCYISRCSGRCAAGMIWYGTKRSFESHAWVTVGAAFLRGYICSPCFDLWTCVEQEIVCKGEIFE